MVEAGGIGEGRRETAAEDMDGPMADVGVFLCCSLCLFVFSSSFF
jgi:hypothetical protein